jgi:hypothetical protein
MNLSNDIFRVIFGNLPITDKRNLLRTCQEYAQQSELMEQATTEFFEMIDTTKYVIDYGTDLTTLCKFTIELVFDRYAHLIPKKDI